MGSLRLDGARRKDCTAENLECRDACMAGDADACLGRAYQIEREESESGEAAVLYNRACQLGLAVACTNYGATLWIDASSADAIDCSRRIFEKTCSAKERFGCGMLGRMLVEHGNGPEDVKHGQAGLERSCEQLKGFPCRVLAKHLESGVMGPYAPDRIKTLLARACDGGDEDACGEHRTADETFKPR